jgi:uncharacterized protein involved in response to NO
MSTSAEGRPAAVARQRSPAFLTYGFRPFFLGAGLWSAAALLVWIWMFAEGAVLPSRFDPLAWHIHEMLFGFAMAAIAGFLLTAIPNWTGRPPIAGAGLALLAGLWVLGRVACLISALLPVWCAIVVDVAFPAVLAVVVAREIVAGRNWRNLVMLAPLGVFGAASLLMHFEAAGLSVPMGLGWRLGLAAVLVLISVVAGRIVPSFTRNWLAKRGKATLPAAPGRIDRAALGLLHAGLFAWVALPEFAAVGFLLLAGAGVNFWRLLCWRGRATIAEPLLVILHIGYAWLVLGSAILGLSMLDADVPRSAAIHALTAGAIATMILAVMTRAMRGHTGRALSADSATSLIFVFVTLAAITRVAAAVWVAWMMPLIILSAAFWIPAFLLFVTAYGSMLLLPRRPG